MSFKRSNHTFFVDSKTKCNVSERESNFLSLTGGGCVYTITTDNGVEFMNHKNICKALGCTVYFADPYCSGQKGAVENANKILREFFPKGTVFRSVTQEELNKVQYPINDRPRKKLEFSTPKIELFKQII